MVRGIFCQPMNSRPVSAVHCSQAWIWNSFWPKRWASSVFARLAVSSPILACFSGVRGVAGLARLRFWDRI